jgi:hypothetical protein
VRERSRLTLYVNGDLAAHSTEFDPAAFDLDNAAPLKIGAGTHDVFCGTLRDVRLYSRALAPEEVRTLATEE